jgi:hypothetical protein
VNRNRDSASVVFNSDPTVFGDGDVDGVAVTGESFVDRVVNDFINEVMKSAGSGGADIHTRAFTNGF